MSFGKFLTKYSGELSTVVGLFHSILPALPISPTNKSNVDDALAKLEAAAKRVEESAAKQPSVVEISKQDLEAAIAAALPDMVAAEVSRQLALIPAPAPESEMVNEIS